MNLGNNQVFLNTFRNFLFNSQMQKINYYKKNINEVAKKS